MPTKRNRRVGVQSRKVKKQKLSRKLSVSGKARKRGSSTHGSSTHGSGTHGSKTRRRVQRGGDPMSLEAAKWIIGGVATIAFALWAGHGGIGRSIEYVTRKKDRGEKEVQYSYS